MTRMADFYDRYWQHERDAPPLHRAWTAQRIAGLQAALAGLPSGAPVLDAGCGLADFSRLLLDSGYAVTGIDLAAGTLAARIVDAPTLAGRLLAASLEGALPFPAETFAAAWSTEVIEHVFDVHAMLAELNRVLQPGGLLILTTPYHGLIKNVVLALHGFEQHFDPYVSHIRFFTRRSLAGCLERAGFRVESARGIGRFWPVWMSHFVVARKVNPPGPPPEIHG